MTSSNNLKPINSRDVEHVQSQSSNEDCGRSEEEIVLKFQKDNNNNNNNNNNDINIPMNMNKKMEFQINEIESDDFDDMEENDDDDYDKDDDDNNNEKETRVPITNSSPSTPTCPKHFSSSNSPPEAPKKLKRSRSTIECTDTKKRKKMKIPMKMKKNNNSKSSEISRDISDSSLLSSLVPHNIKKREDMIKYFESHQKKCLAKNIPFGTLSLDAYSYLRDVQNLGGVKQFLNYLSDSLKKRVPFVCLAFSPTQKLKSYHFSHDNFNELFSQNKRQPWGNTKKTLTYLQKTLQRSRFWYYVITNIKKTIKKSVLRKWCWEDLKEFLEKLWVHPTTEKYKIGGIFHHEGDFDVCVWKGITSYWIEQENNLEESMEDVDSNEFYEFEIIDDL